MKFASIDIETTGLYPDWCQALEIGIVIDDFDDPKPYNALPVFHCYITYGRIVGEPWALAKNHQILMQIAKHEAGFIYYQAEEVGAAIAQFFKTHDMDGKIIAAGKNFSSFDAHFLNKLPHFQQFVRFHHRAIDPVMLYFDPKIHTKELPSLSDCVKAAGLDIVVQHDAVADAMVVVQLIRHKFRRVVLLESSNQLDMKQEIR